MIKSTGFFLATLDFLMSFAVAAVVMMNPSQEDIIKASDKPVCQMAVDIQWPLEQDADVDLWVMGPDGMPVGYSAKDGRVFNLIRDDLGNLYSGDAENKERACARLLPDGEYIVNTHLYSSRVPHPIDVVLSVTLIDVSRAEMEEIVEQTGVLNRIGDELTLIRFKLKDGQLVEGSENVLPIKLRERKR